MVCVGAAGLQVLAVLLVFSAECGEFWFTLSLLNALEANGTSCVQGGSHRSLHSVTAGKSNMTWCLKHMLACCEANNYNISASQAV